MHQRQRALGALVLQVRIEGGQLEADQHPLVVERARRARADVQSRALGAIIHGGQLADATDHIQLALEGVLIETVSSSTPCLRRRRQSARAALRWGPRPQPLRRRPRRVVSPPRRTAGGRRDGRRRRPRPCARDRPAPRASRAPAGPPPDTVRLQQRLQPRAEGLVLLRQEAHQHSVLTQRAATRSPRPHAAARRASASGFPPRRPCAGPRRWRHGARGSRAPSSAFEMTSCVGSLSRRATMPTPHASCSKLGS